MKLEQIIKLRFGIQDIKKAANNGVNNDISNDTSKPEFDFKSYPWDTCISDNEPKYGAKGAAKVCGAIKNMAEQEMDEFKTKKMEPNPCWEGYEPVGLKPDGSPNCVPMKASSQDFVIPQPETGEDKQHYVSRCVKALSKENKPQDQILAICYAQIEKK